MISWRHKLVADAIHAGTHHLISRTVHQGRCERLVRVNSHRQCNQCAHVGFVDGVIVIDS